MKNALFLVALISCVALSMDKKEVSPIAAHQVVKNDAPAAPEAKPAAQAPKEKNGFIKAITCCCTSKK